MFNTSFPQPSVQKDILYAQTSRLQATSELVTCKRMHNANKLFHMINYYNMQH